MGAGSMPIMCAKTSKLVFSRKAIYSMEIIYIGSIFCAVITAFVLLKTQTTYQAFSDRLLAGFLLAACYWALLYLLITSKTILSVPHLFKTAAPVNFLLPPLAFIYARSVLRNETRFYKKDIFHAPKF